jgi:hypothetical protein
LLEHPCIPIQILDSYASLDEIQGKPSNSTKIPDAPPSNTLPKQPPKNFNTNSFDNPNMKSMELLIDVDSDAHQYDELKKPAVENISSGEYSILTHSNAVHSLPNDETSSSYW